MHTRSHRVRRRGTRRRAGALPDADRKQLEEAAIVSSRTKNSVSPPPEKLKWVRGKIAKGVPPGWETARVPKPREDKVEMVPKEGTVVDDTNLPPGVTKEGDRYYAAIENTYEGGRRKTTLRKMPKGFAIQRICAVVVRPIGMKKKGGSRRRR